MPTKKNLKICPGGYSGPVAAGAPVVASLGSGGIDTFTTCLLNTTHIIHGTPIQ